MTPTFEPEAEARARHQRSAMDSVHPDRRHAIDAPGHGEIDLAGHLEDTEVLRSRERFQRLDIAGRGFSGPHVSAC